MMLLGPGADSTNMATPRPAIKPTLAPVARQVVLVRVVRGGLNIG